MKRMLLLIFLFIVPAFSQTADPFQLYLTQLKAAEAYLRLNQTGEAQAMLNAVAPEFKSRWEWKLLNTRSDRSVSAHTGHNGGVVGLAVSPDGRYIASGGADNIIIIWEAASLKPIRQIEGHKRQVNSLDFSPDSRRLLSASADKTLRLWQVSDGAEIRNYNAEFTQGVYQAKFSPDGRRIGAVSWEMSAGNKLPVVGFAKVLDTETGRLVQRFNTDDHPAASLDFSTDGSKLFTGTWGFHIKQHDIHSGQTDWDFDISNSGYYSAVQSVDLSPDSQRLAQCGKDNRIRMLDAADGKLLWQIEPHQGHNAWVNCVRFSPDGKQFASAADDGLLLIWDALTGSRLFTFNGHAEGINRLAWLSDKQLITSSNDGTIRLWDTAQPGDLAFRIGESGPWAAPLHPDGRLMAVTNSSNKLSLWNVDTGREERLIDTVSAIGAAFSSDGRYLAAGADKTVPVYETATGKKLFEGSGHRGRIPGMAWLKSQNLFASAGDRTVRLYHVPDGKEAAALQTGSSAYSVAFTPDEKWLAAGCTDGKVKLYETGNFQLADSLQSGSSLVHLSISHDGRYLATAGGSGELYCWDLPRRKMLFELRGHSKAAYGTTFHPSQPYLITASYDRSLRVWDVAKGINILTLFGFDHELYTVSVSADASKLVVTGPEGHVRVMAIH
jgi:WD40 repeat protein